MGIVAALMFYPVGGQMLSELIPQIQIANIVSFWIIFLTVSILVSIVGMLISKMIKGADLSFYDRVAGGAFGLIKGYILVAVLVIIISTLFPSSIRTSKIAPYIVKSVNMVTDILPKDYQREIDKQRKSLENIDVKEIEKNTNRVTD